MAKLSFRLGKKFGSSDVCNRTLDRFKVARLATRALMLLCGVLVLLSLSGTALAQADLGHLELHGGYTHITSDGGLDGFNAGAALRFTRRVSMSYLVNYLIGPQIFFPSKKLTFKNQQLIPFAEFQFGGSHISTTIEQAAVGSRKSSENAYSWLLGGGADYGLSRHWSGRINGDLFRTHFASTGQSRFRLVLGIVYSFAGK